MTPYRYRWHRVLVAHAGAPQGRGGLRARAGRPGCLARAGRVGTQYDYANDLLVFTPANDLLVFTPPQQNCACAKLSVPALVLACSSSHAFAFPADRRASDTASSTHNATHLFEVTRTRVRRHKGRHDFQLPSFDYIYKKDPKACRR